MDFKEKLDEIRLRLHSDNVFSAKFFADPEKVAEEYIGAPLDDRQRKDVLTLKVIEGLNEIQRTIDTIRDDMLSIIK